MHNLDDFRKEGLEIGETGWLNIPKLESMGISRAKAYQLKHRLEEELGEKG